MLDNACTIYGKTFSTQKSLTNHSSHHKGDSAAFYFFTDVGQHTGSYATSLMDFYIKLPSLDTKSIDVHMNRGDFQNYARARNCMGSPSEFDLPHFFRERFKRLLSGASVE